LNPDIRQESEEVDLSVVVPVYNEVESLEPLYHRLQEVLDQMNRSYEVLLVDDGSNDGSLEKMKSIHAENNRFKIIQFRRNFGQTAAIAAGFRFARGKVVVTMDADLQNDPQDIPIILEKMEEGYDVVSGWRKNRHDQFLTRTLPSVCANWFISQLTGVGLHDYGCTLKAYAADVVKNINLYGEMHRYIPALASWLGVSVAEVPVTHHRRKYGRSKYGLSRMVRVLLDIMVLKFLLSYSTRPIQVFGLVGLISGSLGLFISLYLTVERLVFGQPLADRPLLLLGVLLIFVGLQFISMGLLGEMTVRTYYEALNKPIYFVKRIID
jgi:glycosyltransferase involved in cell wall biosynthesis